MNSVVAIIAMIAAVLALVPVAASMFSRGAEARVVDYGTGQQTSPNLVLPHKLIDIERPPPASDGDALREWAVRYDAVYADNMSVTFTATSDKVQPTIITAVRVEVVRRDEPLGGTWIAPDGGGPQAQRMILADLSTDPPTAVLDGSFSFPLQVSDSETELFTVRARAENCHCFWQIEIDIIAEGGETRTLSIDDEGEPFEVTSTGNTAEFTYLPVSADSAWPRPTL